MTSMAWSVSMLVYIESASAVKSMAFGGRSVTVLTKSMTLLVSLVYVLTKGVGPLPSRFFGSVHPSPIVFSIPFGSTT
jgi:hypothetical protein